MQPDPVESFHDTSNDMTREKAVSKIAKLLKIAADPVTNPKMAANYRKHAVSLMHRYHIADSEVIETEVQSKIHPTWTSTEPPDFHIHVAAELLRKFFFADMMVTSRGFGKKWQLVFESKKPKNFDEAIAVFDVIERRLVAGWDKCSRQRDVLMATNSLLKKMMGDHSSADRKRAFFSGCYQGFNAAKVKEERETPKLIITPKYGDILVPNPNAVLRLNLPLTVETKSVAEVRSTAVQDMAKDAVTVSEANEQTEHQPEPPKEEPFEFCRYSYMEGVRCGQTLKIK